MKFRAITKKLVALATVATCTLALTACGGSGEETTDGNVAVKIGVVGSIYEDIWKEVQVLLVEEGIDLEIISFSDYVTPNSALANGEIDINAFQHQIFLESDSAAHGYEIENIGNTFIVPLKLYSNYVTSVDQIKDGDTIAIADDITIGGRAIKGLAAMGLVNLKADAGFSPELDDIESYNVDIKIVQLSSSTIPAALPDVTAAFTSGNFALDFGLDPEAAIFDDVTLDEEPYWNLIAARSADLEDADTVAIYKKIVEAYQSQTVLDIFEADFAGVFIPCGWGQDLLEQ